MSQIAVLPKIGGTGGEVVSLTGNSGGVVSPDGSGNIDVLGGTGITIVGTPLTNTLTVTNTALNPTQSAFYAFSSGNIATVTGDGTTYTIIWDSTSFDVGSNFNTSTGVFTAPATGKYYLELGLGLYSVTSSHTSCLVQFVVNATPYYEYWCNCASFMNPGGYLFIPASLFTQLNIGDTVDIQVTISNGTKVVGIYGGGFNFSHFSGFLVNTLVGNMVGNLAWIDATAASYTLATTTGYVCDRGGGVAFTLPATATLGSIIKIVGKTGLWTIAQNANQQIDVGPLSSTIGIGGSVSATLASDSIELICITAGASTVWRADSYSGFLNVV